MSMVGSSLVQLLSHPHLVALSELAAVLHGQAAAAVSAAAAAAAAAVPAVPAVAAPAGSRSVPDTVGSSGDMAAAALTAAEAGADSGDILCLGIEDDHLEADDTGAAAAGGGTAAGGPAAAAAAAAAVPPGRQVDVRPVAATLLLVRVAEGFISSACRPPPLHG